MEYHFEAPVQMDSEQLAEDDSRGRPPELALRAKISIRLTSRRLSTLSSRAIIYRSNTGSHRRKSGHSLRNLRSKCQNVGSIGRITLHCSIIDQAGPYTATTYPSNITLVFAGRRPLAISWCRLWPPCRSALRSRATTGYRAILDLYLLDISDRREGFQARGKPDGLGV